MASKRPRKTPAQKPNNPATKMSENPEEPTDFRGKLAKAWEGWLKLAVVLAGAAAVFFCTYYLIVYEVISKSAVGPIAAIAVLVLALLTYAERLFEKRPETLAGLLLVIALAAAAALAGLYPILGPYLPGLIVYEGRFESAGESVELEPQAAYLHEWMLLVHSDLEKTSAPFELDYAFRIGTPADRDLVRGRFERKWGAARSGARRGQEDLVAIDRAAHRIDISLAKAPQLELASYKGEPKSPLIVKLYAQPASWLYFMIVLVPLLLAASLADVLEKSESRIPFYTSRAGFLTFFGFIYANTLNPQDLLGQMVFALSVAMVAAVGFGWLFPRLLGPIVGLFRRA